MSEITKPIPETLHGAIHQLFNTLSKEEVAWMRANDPGVLHHGFGTNLRNTWKLWEEGNLIVLDMKKRFKLFGHADDVSGLILEGVKALVMDVPLDAALEKKAESYRKHWKRAKIDPETGKRL